MLAACSAPGTAIDTDSASFGPIPTDVPGCAIAYDDPKLSPIAKKLPPPNKIVIKQIADNDDLPTAEEQPAISRYKDLFGACMIVMADTYRPPLSPTLRQSNIDFIHSRQALIDVLAKGNISYHDYFDESRVLLRERIEFLGKTPRSFLRNFLISIYAAQYRNLDFVEPSLHSPFKRRRNCTHEGNILRCE